MKPELKNLLLTANLQEQDKVLEAIVNNWKGNAWLVQGSHGAVKNTTYALLQNPNYSTNRKLLGVLKSNNNLLYPFMLNKKDKDVVVLEKF